MPIDEVSHQVIIFGFNRPEMLARRLEEVLEIAPRNVFISIDYKDELMSQEIKLIIESFLPRWPANSSIEYRIFEVNQGLVRHITQTITECLNHYECAVIIEDDISISRAFYDSALGYMKSRSLRNAYSSFSGFSVFPKFKPLQNFNAYRESPYFACWGWVIARENWNGYKVDLNGEDIILSLTQSKVWNSLNRNQQITWLGRFNKAKQNPANTWDIQFQYHSFKIGKLNLVPVMRTVDNEGFSDFRSTHTRNIRPKILGKFNFNTTRVINVTTPLPISKLLARVESIIFFEDSRIHPSFKKVIKKFL